MWDPVTQTYKGGIVPSHHTSTISIDELLKINNGQLKIFGYGSLCWSPGTDGVLSLATIDMDESSPTDNNNRRVTTTPGRAIRYQRCWSQRSADHRGLPQFNGIVCTLLSDEEVYTIRCHQSSSEQRDSNNIVDDGASIQQQQQQRKEQPSMTEGLIYTVDVELVDDCLAELDFREKGGYARDVIDVVEDDTGKTIKALLYRGTPDNPAFWKRVLLDLSYAAAIISVAVGPSGPNDEYLFHLHTFLTNAAQHSSAAAHALEDHSGDIHTGQLANMVKLLQTTYRPYFIFGAGSNEHRQLLLDYGDASMSVEEVNELTEMLLVVPRRQLGKDDEKNDTNNDDNDDHIPQSLHAGGGHSALLTNGGDLYLWGWNDSGQLGRRDEDFTPASSPALNVIHPLSNIKVEKADLGHTHTLIIENETGRLFGFGENGRGQVRGCVGSDSSDTLNHVPQTPIGLSDECFVDVAAGLFHSAAITKDGELITWGCGRFGQCLRPATDGSVQSSTVGRWHPPDGSKLRQVACGRRHTLVLDEHGRIWTLGENKYGQLGRKTIKSSASSTNTEPQLVEGRLGRVDSGCYAIHCGWSHVLALCRENDSEDCTTLYGWGRNDKGQLGKMPSVQHHQQQQTYITTPQVLKLDPLSIQAACCGAESSHILDIDGNIHSTGWNEHGNLAIGQTYNGNADSDCDECSMTWVATSGARVVAPPPSKAEKKLFAAGGAHLITMTT